jgi:hypothetical protein
MYRTNRFAIVAAAVLLLVLASTTLATRAPARDPAPAQGADEAEAQDAEAPDPEGITHATERLNANGISADEATVADLATEYGVGGAVRVLAWSAETGVSVDDIRALRAEGKGWGVIARELGVHPGIGTVMGQGGGHGRDNAPGLQKDRGEDADD